MDGKPGVISWKLSIVYMVSLFSSPPTLLKNTEELMIAKNVNSTGQYMEHTGVSKSQKVHGKGFSHSMMLTGFVSTGKV